MATTCCGQQNIGSSGRLKHSARIQLIDEIKNLLENMDNDERGRSRNKAGRVGGTGGLGPLSDVDLERECREYRKRRDCSPPLITSIATHEYRPTGDITRMQHENTSRITYVDAAKDDAAARLDPMPPAPWELPRTPSQELRAGTLYPTCECRRRNGLQHDCPRWQCGGRPECVAVNPGPCCPPAKARKPVRGDRRHRPGNDRRDAEPRRSESSGGQLRENPNVGASAPAQPRQPVDVVIPVIVRVADQGGQEGGAPAMLRGVVTCQSGSAGGQVPPGARQLQQDPCLAECGSFGGGAGKITGMPGPHGWTAGAQQNATQGFGGAPLMSAQGGQRGGPVMLAGPGMMCMCRPAGQGAPGPQGPQQAPRGPQQGYTEVYELVMVGRPNAGCQ